jgi:hypothetical protein
MPAIVHTIAPTNAADRTLILLIVQQR